jgi:hypothetical protein
VQQPFARCSASGKKASRENPQISRLENIKYFSAWFTGSAATHKRLLHFACSSRFVILPPVLR